MNYMDYKDTRSLIKTVEKADPKVTVTAAHTASNQAAFEKWTKANGYTLHRFKISKDYYATRDLPIWERLGRFYGNMIKIDTPWAIHDPKNPNLPRYLKIKHDPLVGWAVVGSGTKYRYQLYFNSKFPYIHENFLKFNLGTSYPTYAGEPVSEVIGGGQGPADSITKTFPNGRKLITSDDVYTRAYQPRKHRDPEAYEQYKDDYTSTEQLNRDPSMVGTSVRAGFIGLIISYAIAIPMAIYMARKKRQVVRPRRDLRGHRADCRPESGLHLRLPLLRGHAVRPAGFISNFGGRELAFLGSACGGLRAAERFRAGDLVPAFHDRPAEV